MIKTTLKLGSVTGRELAAYMDAKLMTLSEEAPLCELNMVTDTVTEISAGSLFLVSEDNSLAEMMAASKKGARCVLCTKAPASLEKIPDVAVLVCKDVWEAMGRFAREYLKRGHQKTIALTGSAGKTRTGEFIYSVLVEQYRVYKTPDKKSTPVEDTLTMLEMPPDTDFFLAELKIHEKKDIKRLSRLVDCDMGIITALKSNVDENANLDVLGGLKEDGEIALSAEDESLSLICAANHKTSFVSVRSQDAELCAVNIREHKDRITFDIQGKKVYIKQAEIHTPGMENVYSALFAAFVGLRYGIPEERIKTGLKNFHASKPGVGIYTVGDVTFIEDGASATADSVKCAVDTLCDIAKVHKGSRKIALMGDIRDFGQDTRVLHEKMGAYIAEQQIDKLFTFGVAAEQMATGARRAGMKAENISGNLDIFSPQKSAEAAAEAIHPGDVVLIKISRPNAVSVIVNYLKARFEK